MSGHLNHMMQEAEGDQNLKSKFGARNTYTKSNRHDRENSDAVKAASQKLKIFPNGLYSRLTGQLFRFCQERPFKYRGSNGLLGLLLALHARISSRQPTMIMGVGRETD